MSTQGAIRDVASKQATIADRRFTSSTHDSSDSYFTLVLRLTHGPGIIL
jgi:hypothetical protein